MLKNPFKNSRLTVASTAVALFLMFSMAVSLVALPIVNAQATWSIYIEGRTSDWRIRGEVRFNNVRNQTTYTGIQLAVRPPGATAWTYLGPFSTSDGRVDHFYQGWTVAGDYAFQYIVPPQGALPTNPATTDGKWYSSIVNLTYTRPTQKTYPFINAVPNPVGVGQEVLLHLGITHPRSLQPEGWEGITITVTKPDNTTTTLGPFRTDSTGGTGTTLVPDQIGTYKLQTRFPEQVLLTSASKGGGGGTTPAGTVMLASDSVVLNLIVQTEPIQHYPGVPLPTEYWTRPIDAQLREWYQVSGSDMDPGRASPRNFYLPYNEGPESAHILWVNAYTVGGLVGGGLGDPTFYEAEPRSFELGDAYEGKWSDAIIVAGRGYYRVWESVLSTTGAPYRAVDLRTGEILWTKTFLDNQSIALGQLMYWDTYDFHGVYDYLIVQSGTNWFFFDSHTGNWHYTLTNRPTTAIGTFGLISPLKFGPKGELLFYNVNLANGWMALWNSTNIPALYQDTTPGTMGWGQWRPFNKTVDAQGPVSGPGPNNPTGLNGYQWNKTIPTGLPGSVRAILNDRIIGSTMATGTGVTSVTNWAISLKPGQEGQLLFNKTWSAPAEWASGGVVTPYEASTNYGENGVMVYGARELTKFYGFSTQNGDFLWETPSQIATDPDAYLNWYGWTALTERPTVVVYDKLIATGIGGIVYAYDVKTGQLAWKYKAVDQYSEFLFNNNWWLFPLAVTGGKIYFGSLEHSPIDPRPRGAPFLALNVETGEEVFRVNGLFRQSLWGGQAVMGDSVILTQDTYDQRVYAIGKGPSALTVTAPDAGVAFGSSVVIRGKVTDISPGTRDIKLEMRFPNGVAAVADEYMSDWMLYVYKQFPRPADAVGVQVIIDVIDANGNYRTIGTTTSDASGKYGFTWTPDIPGDYTVIATFAGSKSYYPSYDVTYFTVEEAPAATLPPTPPPASMTDTYVAGFGIAIIIAIVAVGIAILIVIKRK